MDIQKARDKSIIEYLLSKGYSPSAGSTSNTKFYLSMFSNEKTPSLSVDTSKNMWKDFSSGKGGDVISLVQELENKTFREAVDTLIGNEFPVFSPTKKKEIEIISTCPIKNLEIIEYIVSRKIDIYLARLYLIEIKYRIGEYTHVGFGMENIQGGWELRSFFKGEWHKLSKSPKDIAIVRGRIDQCNVFEGMFDFLSFLMENKQDNPLYTSIILNTTTLKNRVRYPVINAYVDNDNAGDDVVQYYRDNGHVNDMRSIFKNYNDYAEYWEKKV